MFYRSDLTRKGQNFAILLFLVFVSVIKYASAIHFDTTTTLKLLTSGYITANLKISCMRIWTITIVQLYNYKVSKTGFCFLHQVRRGLRGRGSPGWTSLRTGASFHSFFPFYLMTKRDTACKTLSFYNLIALHQRSAPVCHFMVPRVARTLFETVFKY
jgi:hypothetical protein